MLLRMLQLVINRFRVIRKRSVKLRILAKIGIFFHVDLLAHLFDGRSGLIELGHLSVEIGHVVAEARDRGPGAYLEMSGDKMIGRKSQDRIQCVNPIRGAALIHCRARIAHVDIAGGDGALIGKINVQIAHGVCRAWRNNFHRIVIHVDGHFLGYRFVAGRNDG